jgi:hypothetical protein
MATRAPRQQHEESGGQSEYMRGGKGRTDDVRGSGIYPTSAPDAPPDAERRTVSDFVKHKGRRKPATVR